MWLLNIQQLSCCQVPLLAHGGDSSDEDDLWVLHCSFPSNIYICTESWVVWDNYLLCQILIGAGVWLLLIQRYRLGLQRNGPGRPNRVDKNGKSDKLLNHVQSELDSTINVMRSNLGKALNRGDKLEDLEAKSGNQQNLASWLMLYRDALSICCMTVNRNFILSSTKILQKHTGLLSYFVMGHKQVRHCWNFLAYWVIWI